MPIHVIASVGVIAALVSGCAHYAPKQLAPASTAARIEARTLSDAGLRTFMETNAPDVTREWPRQEWDLTGLTLAAFYFHPSLEVARAQWRLSQAEIKTAGGRPNPVVTAGPGYNSSALSGVNPWMPFVTLDIPVETAGKRGYRIARAEHLSEAARMNIATTVWQVRSNLRASLLDFVASRSRVALLRTQSRMQEETLRLLRDRLQAGAISGSEITVFQVSLAKTQADLADALRQEARAHSDVATAVGIPLSALTDIHLNFDLGQIPNAEEIVSDEVRRQALQGRADILSALAEYAASQTALQLEIAKQYPDVHLSPGYQWDQGENKWQLGVSIELPLLNRNQGPIAEARARREEAAARFEELQARVLGEIDSAITVLRASRQNLDAAQAYASAQEKQTASVVAQYQAGAVDRLDLVSVQWQAVATELAVLDAEQQLQQSLGALANAVQRPLEGETAPPISIMGGLPRKSMEQATKNQP